ncbi:uncharacterized protein LOC144470154 [Augochlora pura]
MGGRQSRRSVDITTTPKKEGVPADGSVGDAAAPGDGKLERIEETDTKPTTNGIAPHTDVAEDKEKDKDEATEKEKQEDVKAEETKQESAGESPAESAEATTPTDATTPASPNAATSPDSKEPKKKDKMKKKWSFRSISFSKKDKNKPARDEAPKNGDVTKEETLAEGGEEAENGSATAGCPVEEKSAVSSPSAETEAAPVSAASAVASTESKEEASSPSAAATTATAASSPTDEKQEEPTPSAPTPVPVEEKKEEVEKLEAEKKVVEVSPAGGQFVPDPVEVSVFRVQTVATPSSIIERKTSEDIPSLPPSSPPPTPIDPSPLQQAQQAAATASLLAEALKLPAEAAADEDPLSDPVTDPIADSVADPVADPVTDEPPPTPSESRDVPQRLHVSAPDESQTEQAPTPPQLEALPVVDTVVDVDAGVNVVATKSEIAVEQSESPEIKTRAPLPVEQQSPNKPKEDTPVAVAEAPPPLQEKQEHRKENLVCVMELVSKEPQEGPEEVVEQSVEPKIVSDVDSAVSETSKQDVSKEESPEAVVKEIEIEMEEKEVLAEEPPVSICDSVLNTEEGPMPLSEETLVEAKPAVVIPEEEKEIDNTVADVTKVDTQSVEAIPDTGEKLELTIKVVEPEDDEPPTKKATQIEPEVVAPTTFVVEEIVKTVPDQVNIVPEEEDSLPLPPMPESRKACPPENLDIEATVVPCPVYDLELQTTEQSQDAEKRPSSPKDQKENVPPVSFTESRVSDCKSQEEGEEIVEDEPPKESSRLEPVSTRSDELPPAPQDTVPSTDSFEYPLPPEELSCPLATNSCSIVSETKSEFPVPDADDKPSLRNPTETLLLTPPRSPSPQSIVVDATVLTTSTIDSLQTHSDSQDHNQNHDQDRDQHHSDENDRSACTIVHEYEDSQLRKTVAKSPAETENQEESSISCQLSNNTTTSTTVQETHQSTPESEAPVENKLTHDSTTESSEEKVTPVAVPIETPAPPPSAPAITEDVASVAKVVEEIEISAKAIAAATIECTTTEIIADAPYENNVNE